VASNGLLHRRLFLTAGAAAMGAGNEIASIVVAAGTWDFFADENFGGESLRLTPGTYPRLAPEWTRHIGSFMCVEPSPPPA
jgi:Beta/Gamma crystallin